MTERVMLGAVLVQARAYDGLKRTECRSMDNCRADKVAGWIDRQVRQYKGFVERTKQYPGHRPRLAYVVKVYAKDDTCQN